MIRIISITTFLLIAFGSIALSSSSCDLYKDFYLFCYNKHYGESCERMVADSIMFNLFESDEEEKIQKQVCRMGCQDSKQGRKKRSANEICRMQNW